MPGAVAVGKLGEGKGAMGGDEHIPGHDVLAAGAGEPHGVPVVVDGAVTGGQQEKSGLRRAARLRDHAAEKLPLRVVAAAAEAPYAGEAVAAVGGHRLPHRGIAAGGERVAVAPDLILRLARKAGDEPLVRGEQAINPAGRAAAVRDGGDDLRDDVEAIFESAIGLRLHEAKQVCLPHTLDHIIADAASGLGLLRTLARKRGDRVRTREQIGNVGAGGRRPGDND